MIIEVNTDPSTAFSDQVAAFFAIYSKVYEKITVKDKERQFRRIGDVIGKLLKNGALETSNPALWTINDIAVIASKVRDTMDVQPDTRAHLLSSVNVLCKFLGNRNVELAKVRYPSLFPKEVRGIPDVLNDAEYKIVANYVTRPDQAWMDLRRSFCVGLILFGGIRPQEDQNIRSINLDIENLECNLEHVKGRRTYGRARTQPMHPDARDLVERYTAAYRARGMSGYLLQNEATGMALSDKTLRKMFSEVSAGCGVRITATVCRATWIERQLNLCGNIEATAVAAGNTPQTIAKNYGRMRPDTAVRTIKKGWETDMKKDTKEESGNKGGNGGCSKNAECASRISESEIWRTGGDSNPRPAA